MHLPSCRFGFALRAVTYTPVPEPGTVAMLALGLMALFGARRL